MTDSSETAPNAPTGETLPRTRPPQDPEAFARWLGLETLKADLKRLELEKLRYAQMEEMRAAVPAPAAPASNAGRTLAAAALLLTLLLAGLGGYLVMQLNALNGEVARLSMAQADLRDALQAMDAQANAPGGGPTAAAPPAAAPIASSSSPLSWTPPASVEPTPTATETVNVPPSAPAADATANAAPPVTPPAEPVAETFTVRVFASGNPAAKAKREAFASAVRADGFTVDVSDNEVFQPLENSITFHPTAAARAEALAKAIRAKYPNVQFEMKPSDVMTDRMRQIIIVNLTDEALR